MSNTELITFDTEIDAFRHEMLDGKANLVVDTTAITESSMNLILFEADVIRKRVDQWNGECVIVDHPPRLDNGEEQTANTKDLFETKIIGTTFNAFNGEKDDGRATLQLESWLDIEKAKRLGHGWIIEKIEAGEKLPVSVGVWTTKIEKSGTFNGKPYEYVAINLVPDHLAIITVGDGACSLESGDCGLSVNKEEESLCQVGTDSTNNNAPCCDECASGINTNQETEMNSIEKKSIFGFLANLGRKSGMDEATIAKFESEHLAENMMVQDLWRQLQEAVDREKGDWTYSVVNIDIENNEMFCYDFNGQRTVKKSFSINNGVATLNDGEKTVVVETSYKEVDAANAPAPANEGDGGDESMSENTQVTQEITEMTDTATGTNDAKVEITQAEFADFESLKAERDANLKTMRADVVKANPALTEAMVENMDQATLAAILKGFAEDGEDEDMEKKKKENKDDEEMKENAAHDFSGQTGSTDAGATQTEEVDSFAQFEDGASN